jgi:hypothetical protein
MRKIAIFLIVTLSVPVITSPTANAEVVESLMLKNKLPVSISTNTLEVELQPKTYSSELRFDAVLVSICEEKVLGCYFLYNTYSGVVSKVKVNGDYYGKTVQVLNVKDNKFIFNFATSGKFQINIFKRYSKDVPGRSVRETLDSQINIPIEITDISSGGIDIIDLAEAGIKLNPYPILKCPEKIKNLKQTISCNLSYGYQDPGYDVLYESFETFKICAYKNADDLLDCELKNPYLLRNIKVDLNTVEKISIPIYKDVDTSIEMVPIIEGKFPEFMDTFGRQNYYFKPAKKSTSTKSKSNSGKWVNKCKTITTRTQAPGLDSRPEYTYTKICEDVWVP